MAVRVRVPLAAPLKFFNMKKFAYLLIFLVSVLLTSCGTRSGYFKLEGKFLNMNQGEFYAYSPDGGFEGVDTIKVVGGRFTFEKPCKDSYTIMIVFPNFSEQPIFAESGKSVDIKADASHLKEMEVKGTKTNELMSKFRKSVISATPPQEKQQAEDFIKENPSSVVSLFLIKRYFFADVTPDYKKVNSLLGILDKDLAKNRLFTLMKKTAEAMGMANVGSALPSFTAYDVYGKLISSAELSSAPVAVIYTWATYNYDSQDMQRELKRRQKKSNGKLRLMGICLDASKYQCMDNLKRDSITSPVVCEGDMMEDKTMAKLGLSTLPDVILLQNGRIVARSINKQELYRRLDQLLR